MKVINEYPTHHYVDEYIKGDLFCPQCGKQSVWEEQSDGDYYCGPDYICDACGSRFTIQRPDISTEGNIAKKIQQLRSGVTLEPATPIGH